MSKINHNPDVLSCLANLSNDEVFTPPSLVNKMLDQLPHSIWGDKNATFFDPFTKSGVFLREIALRLTRGLEKEFPDRQQRVDHILKNQVFGIAITELTSLLSRRSLYCSKIANGKYSVCDEFDNESGNIIFNLTNHVWQKGICIYCGANKDTYDRGDELETYAYEFIHTIKPEEIFNMKFDVIVGNPPYQLSDGGNGASATPIYNKFVLQAKKLNPRYLTMIIPSRWFAGGKGLDEFRQEMLSDERLCSITDFANAKECFPGISLGGGVCYFLWQRDKKGPCQITNVMNGGSNTMERTLNEFPVFVRYNEAISIIRKISPKKADSISSLVFPRNPFGISSSERGEVFSRKDRLRLFSSKGVGYVKELDVTQGKDLVEKYKVMMSKVTSEHAGEPDKNGQMKIISSIKILNPGEVCTDSYLVIGDFMNKAQADNLYNYLKTKFARFLLLQAVTSINLSKDKFCFVPLQDFSQSWSDDKLNKKYLLDEEEIEFINSMIKPMAEDSNNE